VTNKGKEMASRIKMRITAIRYGAKDINMYEFSPLEELALPTGEAGAHISIFLPNDLERQYSLVHAEEKPASYTIGVKLEANSRGGSSFMHKKLRVGMLLDITAPVNHFALNIDTDHSVLIAGGIGITPLYCMMEQLEALNKSWELHYSCRSREDALFIEQFEDDKRVQLYFDDERKGAFLPLSEIVTATPENAHFYCCGPAPMLGVFENALADYPQEHVHVEYFSAKEPAALGGGYKVELALTGIEVDIQPGVSILHTLLEQDIEVPFSCEEGACGACEVEVIEGEPDHRDSFLTDEERASNEMMMICCSGCKGGRLVLNL